MEQPFRLVPGRLTAIVSAIGLAAAPVLTLGRTIRPQSQWAAPSRRQLLLFITDITQLRIDSHAYSHSDRNAYTNHVNKPYSRAPADSASSHNTCPTSTFTAAYSTSSPDTGAHSIFAAPHSSASPVGQQ